MRKMRSQTGIMSEKDNNPQVTTNEIPNSPHPLEEFKRIAKQIKNDITDQKFAKHMDDNDPLRSLRQDFCYPKMKDLLGADLSLVDPNEDCVYFCGNSLGLCPKMTKQYMDVQLEKWAKTGAQGYHQDVPWVNCHEHLDTDMAKIVGGRPGEVAIMNGLTVNLHHLLISFYRPTQKRHKILCETNAFPSDYYTFQSQISLHGYDPETSLLCVEPKVGEVTLRTEDILAKIEEEGDSIAVICFSGVHYYTGQMFDMLSITRAGHAKGCYVGFDLAHAAGNVPLYLHDWDIDFACWCTYKYMNSSPGSLACIFLHNKHKQNDFPKLIGWWGHHPDTKFNMDNKLDLCTGAYGYRVSAPPGLLYPPIKASLEIFNKTSLEEIRAKSKLLTAYLEYRIVEKYGQTNGIAEKTLEPKDGDLEHVHIFTPSDPEQRGAQLSLSFSVNISYVFKELEKRGVICDERKPSVIRVSPAPLYCSFQDVHRFMEYLDQALKAAAITAALDKE
ncbi:kynureninase-like [Mizuhopecten yessoensis]|uniref:Kynureninase n=1 Tax=Mizuhopecten yessoensis TaxID=6573 RepID=A0A210PMX9_MIZYE|nr:kynureninase-like [Mizuhopecten yessoensis]OWF37823.1 Kynureninase [Mizuhopecten yessoensis]